VPWASVFAALRATDFDGYVIMESYNSSLPEFATAHGMFHNVCPDGRAFVEHGLRFLEGGLNRHLTQPDTTRPKAELQIGEP